MYTVRPRHTDRRTALPARSPSDTVSSSDVAGSGTAGGTTTT